MEVRASCGGLDFKPAEGGPDSLRLKEYAVPDLQKGDGAPGGQRTEPPDAGAAVGVRPEGRKQFLSGH